MSRPVPGGFIESDLKLNDLVLTEEVLKSYETIQHWWHFRKSGERSPFQWRLKKGLRVIFHGSPGTGKTETAAILGRELGIKVYQANLSQIVSGYTGETEKNLFRVFEEAEEKNWIVLFKEADVLFGRKTSVNSANDRYSNVEADYLLQLMENYNGIIIVSTNLKDNMNEAFIRRSDIIIQFKLPDQMLRHRLWSKLLTELGELDPELESDELKELSETVLSGAAITNVVTYAMLEASYRKIKVQYSMLREGIARELHKENRSPSG